MCFISNVKDSNLKILRRHTPLDYKRNLIYSNSDTNLETETTYNMHLKVYRQTEVCLNRQV